MQFDAAYSELDLEHSLTGSSILRAYRPNAKSTPHYRTAYNDATTGYRDMLDKARSTKDTATVSVCKVFSTCCSTAWNVFIDELKVVAAASDTQVARGEVDSGTNCRKLESVPE